MPSITDELIATVALLHAGERYEPAKHAESAHQAAQAITRIRERCRVDAP